MLTENVADVAQRFWDGQADAHEKKQGRPSMYKGLKVMNVRSGYKAPNQWIVLFTSRTPDGAVIDSPPVVIVMDDTEAARFEVF